MRFVFGYLKLRNFQSLPNQSNSRCSQDVINSHFKPCRSHSYILYMECVAASCWDWSVLLYYMVGTSVLLVQAVMGNAKASDSGTSQGRTPRLFLC